MKNIFTNTLLTALLSAVPAVLTAQNDFTPSVAEHPQNAQKKEEVKVVATAKKYTDIAEFRQQLTLTEKSKEIRWNVYKDAELVEELLKLFDQIDPASKTVPAMQNEVLGKAMNHATRLKDRAAFDKILAIAKALPDADKNGCFANNIWGLIGRYNSEQQLVYAQELYKLNRNVMNRQTQLNILPAFVAQVLRYHGDEAAAEYYTAEVLTVQNPNTFTDPNSRAAYLHGIFEKSRIRALGDAVCRAIEYNPEIGKKLFEKYQEKFTAVELGNVYVSFCKAAVASKDRAAFDAALAKIKVLPASDDRCNQLREAAAAASGRNIRSTEIVRQQILDDLLKENIAPEQTCKTLIAKTIFPSCFNYGFHDPGSYQRAKALVLQVIGIVEKDNQVLQKLNSYVYLSYLKNAMKTAYDFGDYPFFHETLSKIVGMETEWVNQAADKILAHSKGILLEQPKARIANRKKQEAATLKMQTDAIQRRRTADLTRINQSLASAKQQNKPDLVKKAEADLAAVNAKADAEIKALNDKFAAQNAANEAKDKEVLAQAEAKYRECEERARIDRLSYAGQWEYMVLDLLHEGKKDAALKVLADVSESKINTRQMAPYIRYFLAGGTFDGFDKAFAADKLTSEQKMHTIRKVGAFFFRAKMFEEARKLNDEIMAKMFRPAEVNKSYTVKYMANAPQTADLWSHTPDYKNWDIMETRFTPYFGYDMHNDNLLLKDGKMPELDDKYKSGLHIVFDEFATHIYLRTDDPDSGKVKLGLMNGFGLEWLFRPGKGHAYHSFFCDPLPTTNDCDVNWASATKHYRLTREGIQKDVAVTPEGYAVHVTIPWLFVYDRMPSKDNRWGLGLCIWSKSTRTIGGTVHELERALKLDFEMTPAQRLAIERNVALQAFARYDKIRKDAGGIIQNWNDPVLGDPAFYKASLEGYIAELDEAGKKLLAPAPDAEIHAIFTKYVPQWAEISYMLDEKRAAYLTDQLFK